MRIQLKHDPRAVFALGAVLAGALCSPSVALAGGTDLPDNGTEALGRGGAFAAKADNGLALYYNIAGFARQRGTRLTVDANIVIHDYTFTRDGSYPGDSSNPSTMYAGQPYPKIGDSQNVFPVPFLGLSTDFNYFKRWTFALGVYGPPGIGLRTYGSIDPNSLVSSVKLPNGMTAPSPSRYDITNVDLAILLPTLAVAVSPIKYLDLGLALQGVYGKFDLANANVTPLGTNICNTKDSAICDSYGEIKVNGLSWGLVASLMVHPTPWMDIGLSYRPQIDLHAEGQIHAAPPAVSKLDPQDFKVSFNTVLPHHLRLGIRIVSRYADGTERADLELDGTYENWANNTDRWGKSWDSYDDPNSYRPDTIHAPDFSMGAGGELVANLNHHWKDSGSVRLGGAWNFRLDDISRFIIRAGGYFDSAATDYAHTKLDFNTIAKYAATIGLGYKYRGVTVNVAYAFIYSPTRQVTNSTSTAVDAVFGTNYPPSNYTPVVIGNGKYEGTNQILSVGLSFNFPEFKSMKLMPN